MIRLIGIRIRFSWCASILQILSKHLLEEGMYIALLMYKPCALLFPKFIVKSEKAKGIYITRFTSKEVGIAALHSFFIVNVGSPQVSSLLMCVYI